MSRSRFLIPGAAVVMVVVVVAGLAFFGKIPGLNAAARQEKQLTNALDAIALTSPDFAVAVLDKANDRDFSYRGSERFDTASAVKVSVLACVLLHAQDEKRELTAQETARAKRMIQASDNDATTALFTEVGEVDGLTACNKRVGLTETTVDKAWGLTSTTADDQARLLGNLVDSGSELTVDHRQLIFDLMETVNDDQNWGVPSVAKQGEHAPVKNGWDTRSDDHNLWVVNSLGRIVSEDRETNVSIVVLSHGDKSLKDGIALVEKVAAATRENLKY
ncbi:serine hydrolase [Actinoplanes palleronii]|nr:serine hydrolase [Actinoplanes palleronii]